MICCQKILNRERLDGSLLFAPFSLFIPHTSSVAYCLLTTTKTIADCNLYMYNVQQFNLSLVIRSICEQ